MFISLAKKRSCGNARGSPQLIKLVLPTLHACCKCLLFTKGSWVSQRAAWFTGRVGVTPSMANDRLTYIRRTHVMCSSLHRMSVQLSCFFRRGLKTLSGPALRGQISPAESHGLVCLPAKVWTPAATASSHISRKLRPSKPDTAKKLAPSSFVVALAQLNDRTNYLLGKQ